MVVDYEFPLVNELSFMEVQPLDYGHAIEIIFINYIKSRKCI